MNSPSLAMVMVVRDEERFLESHLAYHHWIGIDRCYLFLHECHDRSADIANKFPWVKVIELKGKLPEEINFISEIHRLAMDQALDWAREDNIDWLLIIDADEFACVTSPPPAGDPWRSVKAGGLKTLFQDIPDWAIEVKLPTFEVLPVRHMISQPFYANEVFVHPGKFKRKIANPIGDSDIEWKGFLGHQQGQSFVRTCAAVRAYDSHRWTVMQSTPEGGRPRYAPLPFVERGWHAHYYLASPQHWREKFSKHNDFPQHWPGESPILLEPPVQLWRECVQQWSEDPEEANSYCREYLFIEDDEVAKGLSRGDLIRRSDLSYGIPQALADLHIEKDSKARSEIHSIKMQDLVDGGPGWPPPSPEVIDWTPAILEDSCLTEFYGIEVLDGQPYRWCKPEAKAQGYLPAGEYFLRMDILKLVRGYIRLKEMEIYLNNERLVLQPSAKGIFSLKFFQKDDADSVLFIKGPHLKKIKDDSRVLSLPITRLVFERVSRPFIQVLLFEWTIFLVTYPSRIVGKLKSIL